jgi:amino acid adenylation domain-containing protein
MASTLLPLTLTQNDIYLDQLRHHGNPLYNVGGYINLRDIDQRRLKDAHARLVEQNELFGLRIVRRDGDVFQTLGGARRTALDEVDFSQAEDPSAAADRWIESLFETAIDMEEAALFRACLLKLGGGRYRYVGMAHHICMDGWGFSNWAKLLSALYDDPSAKAAAAITWKSITAEDASYIESQQCANDKAYWLAHLCGLPEPLFSVRHRNAPPHSEDGAGKRCTIDLSRDELETWKSLAVELRVGISHLFLAMLCVYFLHCQGQRKLVFGLPLHNRRSHAHKQMLGVFAGISPLCVDLSDGNNTLSELARTISKLQLASLRHQRYPLGYIVRDLGEASASRSLYEVGFNYLQLGGELPFGDAVADLVYASNNHGNTPLMATLCEYGKHGAVQLQMDYNQSFISDADMALMKDRLLFLLRSLHRIKGHRIDDISVIPDTERQHLLHGFGDAPLSNPSNACIHQLVEWQAGKTPDAVAVRAGDMSYTYRQLDIKANRIARQLIQSGAKPDDLVGIYMERTADLIVALLGVLKAGAAYVPLDCTYPWQRIQMLVEDSRPHCVLTQRHLSHVLASLGVPSLCVEACVEEGPSTGDDLCPSDVEVSGSNTAYIIYTSGSTGKPKGVQICHGNTVALLDWVRTVYRPEDLAAVLASTSINFDLSVFEIFAPLTCGGCCVVVRDALALLNEEVGVTLINTVPSAMKVLLEQDAVPSGVRVVNLAGEPLPMNVVNELLFRRKCQKVINLYGPSEDTTYSTYAIFEEVIAQSPSIGKAIAGTQLYVLSSEARLLPMGAIGELHIAGNGLARGYLNAPDVTAEKFVPNVYDEDPEGRLYKTGDLVRYRPNGDLEYLGRLDGQVKIRGFRVELGEIQRNLEQLDGVKTAVVLAQEQDALEKRLIAFVERWNHQQAKDAVATHDAWADGLRRSLQAMLPGYMVPAMIFVLEAMPLTPNGKVDKKALATMGGGPGLGHHKTVSPQTPFEIRIAGLWADMLGVDRGLIGTETSLFDFGGHSLLLVRLANEIRHALDVELPITTLFQVTNLGELAEMVEIESTMRLVEEKMSRVSIMSEGSL